MEEKYIQKARITSEITSEKRLTYLIGVGRTQSWNIRCFSNGRLKIRNVEDSNQNQCKWIINLAQSIQFARKNNNDRICIT